MRALHGLEDYYSEGAINGPTAVELDLTYDDLGGAAFVPELIAPQVFDMATSPYVEVPDALVVQFADFGVPVIPAIDSSGNYVPAALPDGFDPSSNLFDFGFEIEAFGDPDLEALIPLVIDIATAAFSNIAEFIQGAEGASIEVAINLLQQGPGVVASAGATSLFFGDVVDGVQELLTGAQIELQTGIDPNGADVSDITVNINTDFLLSAAAFLSTDPDRVVPAGSLDYVSVLTHELFHGLGFFSFRDNSGVDAAFDFDGDGTAEVFESTYGLSVDFDDDLQATYDGQNVVDVYGEVVNLETTFDSAGSDISHFAAFNRDGSIADTILAMMNPSVVGDLTIIGALELAVLEDLGYDISAPSDLQLLNDLESLPFTPTISVAPEVTVADGAASVTIELDAQTLFISIPTSVGVEITAGDGTSQMLRARIAPEDLLTIIELDDAMLRALAAEGATSVSVRLFYPAQAVLANGDVEQVFDVPLGAFFGEGTDGDDTYNATEATVGVGGSGNERVTGSDFDDIYFGDDGADIIISLDGNDRVEGGNDDDYIAAGDGDDIVNGDAGNDYLAGQTGNDVINGGDGEDQIFAGAGDDIVDGGEGDDTIFGGAGDDFISDFSDGMNTINAGSGADRVETGDGLDTVNGGSGDDILLTGGGEDEVFGGSGNDYIAAGAGQDMVFAGSGNDFIAGQDGEDELFGEAGDDQIFAGAGEDLLDGGTGIDTLSGGAGMDAFVFASGYGMDTVLDFTLIDDLLLLNDFTQAEIDAAISGATGDASQTVLDFGNGDILTLNGLALDDLDDAFIIAETVPDDGLV